MTRLADRPVSDPELPDSLLSRRSHGSLEAIIESERRPLRSIGATAREVAARTSVLLADLLMLPTVRIFEGVRPTSADLPRIAHAVSAGCRLAFVESVAWPPGHYAATEAGQIHCDGVYIGQSAGPLLAAVKHWRAMLPRGHRVRAIVVVYPTTPGELLLPGPSKRGLAWTRSSEVVSDILAYLPSGRPGVSVRAVAALLAATVTGDDQPPQADRREPAFGCQPPSEGR